MDVIALNQVRQMPGSMHHANDLNAIAGFTVEDEISSDDEISQSGGEIGTGWAELRVLRQLNASPVNCVKKLIGRGGDCPKRYRARFR
jgi:hypothetical protein